MPTEFDRFSQNQMANAYLYGMVWVFERKWSQCLFSYLWPSKRKLIIHWQCFLKDLILGNLILACALFSTFSLTHYAASQWASQPTSQHSALYLVLNYCFLKRANCTKVNKIYILFIVFYSGLELKLSDSYFREPISYIWKQPVDYELKILWDMGQKLDYLDLPFCLL